jgi:hypothetical protein
VEKASGEPVRLVSAVSGEGVKDLLRAAWARVARRAPQAAAQDRSWTP